MKTELKHYTVLDLIEDSTYNSVEIVSNTACNLVLNFKRECYASADAFTSPGA